MAESSRESADGAVTEEVILDALIGLHRKERRLYREVLELTRRQGEYIRSGGDFGKVRALLARKKSCLGAVDALDRGKQEYMALWRRGGEKWSAAGRRRLHGSLAEIAALVEEITTCEERNDLDLAARTQEM